MKGIKQRIKNGESLLGGWLNMGSATTVEMLGKVGYDWMLIDLEHVWGDKNGIISKMQVLARETAASFVRVEGLVQQRTHRVLDFGAEGVMFPRINTAEEAKEAISYLHYPPKGVRGVAKMVRATNFGKDFDDYFENINDNIVGLIQIETLESVECVDEIAALEGVDVLFIGPADLSMAMGCFGDLENPRFIEAVSKTVNAARKYGKAVGILLFNPEDLPKYQNMGIQMIACGADSAFVNSGANQMIKRLKELRK